jgi:hypothetical protein
MIADGMLYMDYIGNVARNDVTFYGGAITEFQDLETVRASRLVGKQIELSCVAYTATSMPMIRVVSQWHIERNVYISIGCQQQPQLH